MISFNKILSFLILVLAQQGLAQVHTFQELVAQIPQQPQPQQPRLTFEQLIAQIPPQPQSPQPFSGPGHVLGGTNIPSGDLDALRARRLASLSQGGQSEESVDATVSTVTTVSNMLGDVSKNLQKNADQAYKVAKNAPSYCTRNGNQCINGVNIVRQSAEETARQAQNNANLANTVSKNFNAISDNIPVSGATIAKGAATVAAGVSVYSSAKEGKKVYDDTCFDEDGIRSLAPVAGAVSGNLVTSSMSGAAFGQCFSTTAGVTAYLGPWAIVPSMVAGVACSAGTNYVGSQLTETVTDAMHGRKRAYLHQNEVRQVFEDLMNIGAPDDDLRAWSNRVISLAVDNKLATLKDAKNFWSKLPDGFVSMMLQDVPEGEREKAKAYVEYNRRQEGDNKFMPSSTQVSYLKNHILSKWCLPSDWYEWIEVWGRDILYTGFKDEVIKDQRTRATNIVDMIDDQRLGDQDFTITMMDGHGRQWLATLLELKNRNYNLKKVHLRIVDIDDAVNDWHELFFPSSYTTVVRSTPEEGGIYKEDVPERGILYMNFCGLGGTNDILKTRLKEFKASGVLSKTLVSISSRGGPNPATYDFLKGLGTEVCSRGKKNMGFHTFRFE